MNLKGKRTYLIAAVWGIAIAANQFGWIDAELFHKVETFLGPLGLASLRAGVGK